MASKPRSDAEQLDPHRGVCVHGIHGRIQGREAKGKKGGVRIRKKTARGEREGTCGLTFYYFPDQIAKETPRQCYIRRRPSQMSYVCATSTKTGRPSQMSYVCATSTKTGDNTTEGTCLYRFCKLRDGLYLVFRLKAESRMVDKLVGGRSSVFGWLIGRLYTDNCRKSLVYIP